MKAKKFLLLYQMRNLINHFKLCARCFCRDHFRINFSSKCLRSRAPVVEGPGYYVRKGVFATTNFRYYDVTNVKNKNAHTSVSVAFCGTE